MLIAARSLVVVAPCGPGRLFRPRGFVAAHPRGWPLVDATHPFQQPWGGRAAVVGTAATTTGDAPLSSIRPHAPRPRPVWSRRLLWFRSLAGTDDGRWRRRRFRQAEIDNLARWHGTEHLTSGPGDRSDHRAPPRRWVDGEESPVEPSASAVGTGLPPMALTALFGRVQAGCRQGERRRRWSTPMLSCTGA